MRGSSPPLLLFFFPYLPTTSFSNALFSSFLSNYNEVPWPATSSSPFPLSLWRNPFVHSFFALPFVPHSLFLSLSHTPLPTVACFYAMCSASTCCVVADVTPTHRFSLDMRFPYVCVCAYLCACACPSHFLSCSSYGGL